MALRLALPLSLLLLACVAAPADARDPGRWGLTGWSSVSNFYWQGMTSDPRGNVYFDGITQGLYRTAPTLRQTGANDFEIPESVRATEGYNHIGDIGYDGAEGGRVLLPLECFDNVLRNTCGTGSIGIADPRSLGFRYYVKLDPAEIPKAMWVEPSPDGQLLWTSSGADLLAYRAADVNPANSAPTAAPIHPVRRLPGATPPSGITGGAFIGGRLFVAGQDTGPFQVWSVDPATGARRLEIEMPIAGESEGVHSMRLLGGELHWLIGPEGTSLTFPPTVAVLHFARVTGRPGLRVSVTVRRARSLRPRVVVKVTRRGRPVPGARVSFAGGTERAASDGKAKLIAALGAPGTFRALARKGGLRGRSRAVRVGPGSL
jgi:hypothetical protein